MKVSELSYRRAPWAGVGVSALVAVLLCLGALNVASRARWHELEDGVLWVNRAEGVVAANVAAAGPAALAGIQPGDLLVAVDGSAVEHAADVARLLRGSRFTTPLTYTLLRLGRQEALSLRLAPVPVGNLPLYFVLSAIGIFTLVIGASVRLRRPGDPATLHFFWLCLAFFGTFTFSFSGRLDRLDWVFYWSDAVAVLLLGPLFLHFTLAFPERSGSWIRRSGRLFLPVLYLPALALVALRVTAVRHLAADAAFYSRAIALLDRLEPAYLSVCMVGGLVVLVQALTQVRSVTARRQLRWIVWGTALGAGPFAVGYALPYALGARLSLPMELSAIPLSLVPLAFASAIIRYRLMDVEVIVKRGLVHAAILLAVLAVYAGLYRLAGISFPGALDQRNWIMAVLGTLVVLLLARPVKGAIQNALDRAFYRDRYDYRRALVGFARDLNSDLDLARLSERLVARIQETFVVDRMALVLSDESSGEWVVIRAEGFDELPLHALGRDSRLASRLAGGQSLALDDPRDAAQLQPEDVDLWRGCGAHYFVPCLSKDRLIAVLALSRRESGEPLNSEDLALLSAVGGQVATALENGRLYRQLQLKADELQRLQEFNENIVESLDSGLIVLDLDGRVLRWNRAMEQLYGLPAADVLGRRLEDAFDGAFLEAIRGARRDAPGGASVYRVPLTGRAAREGERLRVNVAIAPLQAPGSSSGSVTVGSLVIVEDVTERVHLEEQLQISDKMASVGVLAAGVAHEVNTPLTGISSFTQMLLQQADPSHPNTRLLEKIEQQTFRAAKIVSGLLNLSRSSGPTAVERGPVDLNGVINDILALLEPQLMAGKIKVRRELCASPAVVLGVEHKLQQVFLNLFLNARDAMPKGGWLSVLTRVEDGQVVAEVGDTGSGIPNEHLARIYDPFFTTKAMGKGTGLGLSITYGIVREHDGTITCQSAIGQGTQFIMTLPRTAAVPQRSSRASS